jgi:hypothetical protein
MGLEVRWLRPCCGRTGSRTRRALVRRVPRARVLARAGQNTPIWDDIGVAMPFATPAIYGALRPPEADSRRADLGGV